MEYVAGRSLKTIVREQGALDPAAAIDIVVQILRAARFAHRRGVIHRDLKPHNVILDEEGRARVTDFGIARAGASDMTLTGSIMGTAQYLSPEQAQGHAVSARSDLYSVGVILYELLTGVGPVRGRDRGGDRLQAGLGRAAPAERAEPGAAAVARRGRAARARQGPGAALRRRRRVHRGARSTSATALPAPRRRASRRRAPMAVSAAPPRAGTAPADRRAAAAAGGAAQRRGRRRARRRRRRRRRAGAAVGRSAALLLAGGASRSCCCSAQPSKVDGAERRRPDRTGRRRARCAHAGLNPVAVARRRARPSPSGLVISQTPRGRARRRRRAPREHRRLQRPRERGAAGRRRPDRRAGRCASCARPASSPTTKRRPSATVAAGHVIAHRTRPPAPSCRSAAP